MSADIANCSLWGKIAPIEYRYLRPRAVLINGFSYKPSASNTPNSWGNGVSFGMWSG